MSSTLPIAPTIDECIQQIQNTEQGKSLNILELTEMAKKVFDLRVDMYTKSLSMHTLSSSSTPSTSSTPVNIHGAITGDVIIGDKTTQ